MKKIGIVLFFILSFLGFNQGYTQTWDSVGGGVSQEVWAINSYNNNIYAGGFFYSVGGLPVNFITEWTGTIWDTLGSGMLTFNFEAAVNTGVFALTVYHGNLIAGGNFYSAGGTYAQSIAEWNGSSWDSLGSGLGKFGRADPYVYALTAYHGDIIAGGNFNYLFGLPSCVAKWNDTSWSALGIGINQKYDNFVNALLVYNGNLIAAGYFDSAGGVPAKNIAVWNGTSWSSLGTGVSGHGLDGCILALAVYNGKLYAGGYFDSAGGRTAKNIAIWDGNTWSALGSGLDSIVTALGVYNNVLVAGGIFDTAGGIACNNIAEWNDTAWSAMGKGIKGSKNEQVAVNALCVYKGYLYVGGEFDSAGGIHVNNIARWGSPPSDTIKNYTGPFMIYPNPSKGIYTVQIPSGSGQTTVKIYNVLGQEIYSALLIPTPGADFEINLSNCAAGVYPYRVTAANGGIIGQGKLIIQK